MLPACILIVDDKPDVRLSLKVLLNHEFSKVLFADNPETLESLLKSTMVDVVLLDMNYTPGQTTGEEGLKSLRQIKRSFNTSSADDGLRWH